MQELPHELRNGLRLQEISRNYIIVWRNPSVQYSFQKQKYQTSCLKLGKSRYQIFLVLSNFALFLYLLTSHIQLRKCLSSSLCFHVVVFFGYFLEVSTCSNAVLHIISLEISYSPPPLFLLIKRQWVIHLFMTSL